jgi:hypothetical protein
VALNYRSASQNDARYLGKVSIYYPLHPFYGLCELTIGRRFGTGSVEQVEILHNGRWQLVPVWMTDPDTCRLLSLGDDPFCSLPALGELTAVLHNCGL